MTIDKQIEEALEPLKDRKMHFKHLHIYEACLQGALESDEIKTSIKELLIQKDKDNE
jgi:hypothetical protein